MLCLISFPTAQNWLFDCIICPFHKSCAGHTPKLLSVVFAVLLVEADVSKAKKMFQHLRKNIGKKRREKEPPMIFKFFSIFLCSLPFRENQNVFAFIFQIVVFCMMSILCGESNVILLFFWLRIKYIFMFDFVFISV